MADTARTANKLKMYRLWPANRAWAPTTFLGTALDLGLEIRRLQRAHCVLYRWEVVA